jgi:hypothetical protein
MKIGYYKCFELAMLDLHATELIPPIVGVIIQTPSTAIKFTLPCANI